MEVISIERSTYEELLTSFNSFVAQMRALADRGTDKGLGDWLDNQDVCQMLNISPRTLQTLRDNGTLAYSQINRKVYYKPEDVENILHVVADRGEDCHFLRVLLIVDTSSHPTFCGEFSQEPDSSIPPIPLRPYTNHNIYYDDLKQDCHSIYWSRRRWSLFVSSSHFPDYQFHQGRE